MRNKDATMGAVADEAGRLIREREGELPTAREIAKSTGLSMGTIYAHFGSIRGIVRHVVYRRQCSAIEILGKIIEAHDPKMNPIVLFDKIIDSCFVTFQSYSPKLIRTVYKLALDETDRASDLDRVSDRLVPFIAGVIAHDETDTLKALSDESIIYLLRGMISIIRSPLLENSPYFGTPAHISLAKTYLRNMFLKEA